MNPTEASLRKTLFCLFLFATIADKSSFSGAALAVRVAGNYSLTILHLLLSSILLCSATSSFECTYSDFQTLFCSISLPPSALTVTSGLFILEVKERLTPSVSVTVDEI